MFVVNIRILVVHVHVLVIGNGSISGVCFALLWFISCTGVTVYM